MDKEFSDIINLIKQSRSNAFRAINAELIDLYWNIGKYISIKIDKVEWGDSVVSELAKHIQKKEPELKGFSDKNIWRMKQFYETYKDSPKLSTALRETNQNLTNKFKDSYVFEFLSIQLNFLTKNFYSKNYMNCLKVNMMINNLQST